MGDTVYPKKYAHGFVVLCFVVVMQSFIMNSHEVFIHIHQGCFAGTGAIVRLPQCQWSKPDGYGKISQCITTTKHSKSKTVCIFLGIYCRSVISEQCYRWNSWAFLVKLPSGECSSTTLRISQHLSRQWLGAIHYLDGTKPLPELILTKFYMTTYMYVHMSSFGHNELKYWNSFFSQDCSEDL